MLLSRKLQALGLVLAACTALTSASLLGVSGRAPSGLLRARASTCNTDGDCTQGACVNRTCTLQPIAGKCQVNSACAPGGFCFTNSFYCTPVGSQGWAYRDICVENDDCKSNICDAAIMPNNICPGNGAICETVSRCAPGSSIGSTCSTNDDCAEGQCTSGSCQYAAVGTACQFNYECHTGVCASPNSDDNFFCAAKPGGGACGIDNDCSNGTCLDSFMCQQNGMGSFCRDNRDCISNSCITGSNICRGAPGDLCSTNAACASGLCQSGQCTAYGYHTQCNANNQCGSGKCVNGVRASANGLSWISFWCDVGSNGSACLVNADCVSGSYCSGAQAGVKSGTCASNTTSTTTTSTSISTTKSSTSTSSTKASTSTTSTKSSISSKPTTTPTSTKSTTTTTKVSTTSTTTLKPSGATCTTNTNCRSGYCRKPLLSNGTRSTTGACDVKKARGSRCYQNGGCLSGSCNKTAGTCN